MGKRQRREVKANKAAAREELRVARNQRRDDRANGIFPEQTDDGFAQIAVEEDIVVDAPAENSQPG